MSDTAKGLLILLAVLAAIAWGVWDTAGNMADHHRAEGTEPATDCWSWCK